MTTAEHNDDRAAWHARPILLAVFGSAAALVFEEYLSNAHYFDATVWRYAVTTAIGVFAAVIAFTIERTRPGWALGFAALAAALMALVTWSNGPSTEWGTNAAWRLASGALAVAIATPLFQTWRDRHRAPSRFPYVEVHGHAWTDVVVFLAAWAFAAVAFLLGSLIASLFRLIGVDILYDLMRKGWFAAALIGAALGGAVGLLRERDRVVRTLLTVVLVVLRVLAPVLAVFLAAFLLFLPFTGLAPLWGATRSTTPILLGCVAAALVLGNAVIGQDETDGAASRLLRVGARVLSVVALPLAVIAAVSLGLRIVQHGLSVDRLWALVAIVLASVYGVSYLVSALRPGWIERVRATNLRLAFVVAGVAMLLALPVVGFERLATNDQVARLESGRTVPAKFDWAALRFDFGEPGRAAVGRLAANGPPAARATARRALAANNRYDFDEDVSARAYGEGIEQRMTMIPAGAALTPALRDALIEQRQCLGTTRCAAIVEGAMNVVVVQQQCPNCEAQVHRYAVVGGRWREQLASEFRTIADDKATWEAIKLGRVDIRSISQRQVFVDGKPAGDMFK